MDNQFPLFEKLYPQKPKCNVDQRMIKTVFDHYKEAGFPYQVLTDHEKMDEFISLVTYEGGFVSAEKTFTSNSTGVALANSYHPHRYEIQCSNHKTAMSVFRREDLLQRCIKKCIALSGTVDDAKLRSMISIFEGVQVASNFPTGTAKDIYRYFLPNGGCVWDMSCGFGGRLLASIACRNIMYIGTDPSTKTFEGLNTMIQDLRRIGIQFYWPMLFNHGSELSLDVKSGSVDFCFTSPPYFNTERYSEETTQSFKAYPYMDMWINRFIGGTAKNCYRVLRPEGLVAFNIASVKSFPHIETETVKEFHKHGFTLINTYYLAYSMMPGKGKKNKQFESGKRFRKEPIFIFRKDKK
jgi:hypothetical protein